MAPEHGSASLYVVSISRADPVKAATSIPILGLEPSFGPTYRDRLLAKAFWVDTVSPQPAMNLHTFPTEFPSYGS
jgi:hypothetical protein